MLLGFACLLALAVATPALLNKETMIFSRGWTRVSRADPATPITAHVFVKQTNTDELTRQLFAVSDPQSPQYGQHLTQQQVHDLVAPTAESVRVVLAWLAANGVPAASIKASPNSDILTFDTTVGTMERLLHAEYQQWRHDGTGYAATRALSYSLPADVHAHIDFVGERVGLNQHLLVAELSLDLTRTACCLLPAARPDRSPASDEPHQARPDPARGRPGRRQPDLAAEAVLGPRRLPRLELAEQHRPLRIPRAVHRPARRRLLLQELCVPRSLLIPLFSHLISPWLPFVVADAPSEFGRKLEIVGKNTPSNPGIEAMLDVECELQAAAVAVARAHFLIVVCIADGMAMGAGVQRSVFWVSE